MKLKKSKSQGDLGYMIRVEGFNEFIERYCMDIFNEEQEVIGEVKGYVLKVDNIKLDFKLNNGRESFFTFDAISQLCCDVWEFLQSNPSFIANEEKIYFLNRFSFHSEYNEASVRDQELLRILQKKMGGIIYSCGLTELDDDFPENPYDSYWTEHEEILLNIGWEYDEEYSFYVKPTKVVV